MLTSSLLLLLSLLSLSTAIPSPPPHPVVLPLERRFNLLPDNLNLAEQGRQRAKALIDRGRATITGGHPLEKRASEAVNNTGVVYAAKIGVGSPPSYYNLIIDTGSSNTWVGADKKYVKTSTSKNTLSTVSVTYGSGSFSGFEYTDSVTITKDLVAKNQGVGVALTSSGFTGFDGILGIGPVDLTAGTVLLQQTVPTVTDTLFAQKTIPQNQLSVFFAPTNTLNNINGELTFGAPDTSKPTSPISYVPITSTSPSSSYWGIDASATLGSSTSIFTTTSGIVDTGTTLVLIATDAFNKYLSATGGSVDSTTGLVEVTQAQYDALPTLDFTVGEQTYGLTRNAQLFPRSLNADIGGSPDGFYLVVADIGQVGGQGLDFILGYAFLERFYSVYDTGGKRVGLAPTEFTSATTN